MDYFIKTRNSIKSALKDNFLGKAMKKLLVVGVSILAVFLMVLASQTSVVAYNQIKSASDKPISILKTILSRTQDIKKLGIGKSIYIIIAVIFLRFFLWLSLNSGLPLYYAFIDAAIWPVFVVVGTGLVVSFLFLWIYGYIYLIIHGHLPPWLSNPPTLNLKN